ncbi:helix-turn-helix transcriptional regulator [Aneurinibacillus sp. REN35]|uniref:helix-turn-helix transcriptional regulator n=1 Tax=Aneurinibacillus sp. REN35 TaxID=3237286 RepID=UPI0035279682
MNRTDRLLAIMLELRKRKFCRAEDLADTFELCKRTIYRDMQALSESGVPLISIPGKGYSLLAGHFLPPIHLTPEETMTLLVGSRYVEQNLDQAFRCHARTAQDKLTAILPEQKREEVERLKEAMRFLPQPSMCENAHYNEYEHKIHILRTAILEGQVIAFDYRKRFAAKEEETQRRTVHPYGLVNISGIWYLIAHCLLRQRIRHFRLERMGEPVWEVETFRRPDSFRLQEYIPDDARPLSVQLIFDPSVRERVMETRYFYAYAYEDRVDGLYVTLKVRQEEEVFHWLLSWGSKVKVVSPLSLAEKIREEAKAMLT